VHGPAPWAAAAVKPLRPSYLQHCYSTSQAYVLSMQCLYFPQCRTFSRLTALSLSQYSTLQPHVIMPCKQHGVRSAKPHETQVSNTVCSNDYNCLSLSTNRKPHCDRPTRCSASACRQRLEPCLPDHLCTYCTWYCGNCSPF